jgi:hypothetical protein
MSSFCLYKAENCTGLPTVCYQQSNITHECITNVSSIKYQNTGGGLNTVWNCPVTDTKDYGMHMSQGHGPASGCNNLLSNDKWFEGVSIDDLFWRSDMLTGSIFVGGEMCSSKISRLLVLMTSLFYFILLEILE